MNITRPDLPDIDFSDIDQAQRERKRRREQPKEISIFALVIIAVVFLITLAVCCEVVNEACSDQLPQTKIADLSTVSDLQEQTPIAAVDRGNVAGREPTDMQSLGMFEVTYYTNSVAGCGKTDAVTKSGAVARINHTIAVDPKVIPLGTEVIINGIHYTAEDTGSAIKGYKVDIFVESDAVAIKNGVTTAEVYKEE